MPLSSSPEQPSEELDQDPDEHEQQGDETHQEQSETPNLDTSTEKPYDPQNGGADLKLSELDLDEETKRKIEERSSDESEESNTRDTNN